MSTLVQNVAKVKSAYNALSASIEAKGVSVPAGTKLTGMPALVDQIQTGGGGGGGEDYGYLTFTAVEATTLTLKQQGSIAPLKLLKSNDAITWVKWENPSTNGIQLNAGQSVYIKADEDALWKTAIDSKDYNNFQSNGSIKCYGDVRSLVKLVAPADYNYFMLQLFNGCTSLTQAPKLPAITLARNCYERMFQGCTSLTTAPELPATALADGCYSNMFIGCTSLTTAPELPAATLANNCYVNMFQGCTSLTTAPELPAATLADGCYSNMFIGCTSLTTAPELPATNLAYRCYYYMFNGCTSLTTAPELPATTLARNCYERMFNGCTSLTQAPSILPATTLSNFCYTDMFYQCTSLTTAPELPATTLARNCYSYMFHQCTSLTTAPELPAKVVADSCYFGTFSSCTSLKRIKMNASSGNWGINMFSGCTSLELVDMTGSTGVPQLANVNNFENTNDTYKIVVPDSLYDTWIAATNWASIASHIMKQSDWNTAHPDDIL